eukprot:355343-Chlamydomonas_euryale.AAC.1
MPSMRVRRASQACMPRSHMTRACRPQTFHPGRTQACTCTQTLNLPEAKPAPAPNLSTPLHPGMHLHPNFKPSCIQALRRPRSPDLTRACASTRAASESARALSAAAAASRSSLRPSSPSRSLASRADSADASLAPASASAS